MYLTEIEGIADKKFVDEAVIVMNIERRTSNDESKRI